MNIQLTQDEADLIRAAVEISGLVNSPVFAGLRAKLDSFPPVPRTADAISATMQRIGIAPSDLYRVRKLLEAV